MKSASSLAQRPNLRTTRAQPAHATPQHFSPPHSSHMYERTFGSSQLASVMMWQSIEEVYHIGHVICNGRVGTVIKKATHRKTGAHFALKVIRVVETAGQGITRARALKEAHLLSVLDHPNIIRVFGVYESIDEVVLILEYCDGEWGARCAGRSFVTPWWICRW